MNQVNEGSLSSTYERLKALSPGLDLGSLAIAAEVVRLRELWRPKTTRTVLLAESHAQTREKEFAVKWRIADTNHQGNFVKFVYCLANGEKTLAPEVSRNVGTSQYWKIFFSCVNKIATNRDFGPILRSTPDRKRIENKITLLNRMRENGIWLVDASVVSINHIKNPKIKTRILRNSWNGYTGPLIESLHPKPRHIIVIGKFVGYSLLREIAALNVEDCITLPQPQAHLRSPGYFPFYKTYYQKCSGSES
jgi:hypothetical protein